MDWTTQSTVTVPLDPKLDGRANLARYYARAKKARRGLPMVEERTRTIEAEVAELERTIARVEGGEDIDVPIASKAVTPRRGRSEPAPIDKVSRGFVTSDGHEVRVGKGAAANDRLTLAFARGHDLWLHARGLTGAHVVLRLNKGRVATSEALLDAAHLAAHFSDARGEPKVDVMYTEARNVRKVKGAAHGAVNVSKERTLTLRVEAERLARLLDRPWARRGG